MGMTMMTDSIGFEAYSCDWMVG